MAVRVATYRRVSTTMQAEEGESLDIQLQRLHAYALANDWEIVEDYCDAGFSGAKENRPALLQLLKDARAGKFEKIVVMKLDRLTRSVKHFHDLAGEMDRYGVAIVSVTQHLDTSTPTGRLLRNILVDFANFEREMIMERARETKEGLAEQGRWYTGKPPYGMHKLESGQIVPEPGASDQVLRAFTIYDTDPNASIPYVAQQTGLPVTRTTEILKNPVYAGYLGFRRRVKNPDGTKTRLPRSAWRMIPCKGIDPLISLELWERVQERQQSQRWIAKPGGNKFSIFNSLCSCGVCGGKLVRVSSGAKDSRPGAAYYRCTNREENRSAGHVALRQDQLTEAIFAEVDRLFRMDRIWQEAMDARSTLDATAGDDARKVKADLARVEQKIARLVDQLSDGMMADMVRPKLVQLDQERKELQAQHAALSKRTATLDNDLNQFRQRLSSLRRAYDVATWPERGELMRLLIERVDIGLDVTVIQWADPSLPPSTIATPMPRNSHGQATYAAKAIFRDLTDDDLLDGMDRLGRKGFAASLSVAKETLDNELIRRGLKKRKRQSEIVRVLAGISDDDLIQAVKEHGTGWCAEQWHVDRSTVNNEFRIRGLDHPAPNKIRQKTTAPA